MEPGGSGFGTVASGAKKAAPLGLGIVGGVAGNLLARRKQRQLAETVGGQAQSRRESRAAQRDITGDYGMSEAEKRKETASAAEAGNAQIGQQRRQMLQSVVAAGGLGRSGAALEAEKGLGQQQAALNAGAAQGVTQASQKLAGQQRAADQQTLDTALVGDAADQAERISETIKGAQTGYALGQKVKSKTTTGATDTALRALG